METLKKLEKECDELYDKWKRAKTALNEERIGRLNLNFIGKFIKYKDPLNGYTTYMYVRDIYKDTIRFTGQEVSYCLRGFGFDGEFIGYTDCTWFNWDYGTEIYIYGSYSDFKEKSGLIEEISPEEYKAAFEEHMDNVRLWHEQLYNSIIFGKTENLSEE